jgi:M6 family metalloprotease-like protein
MIKRYLFCLLLLTALPFSAIQIKAIPADPRIRTNVQTGGDTLSFRVIGDERAHIAITLDGYPLIFNDITRSYEYAKMQNGVLITTGINAMNAEKRPSVQTIMLQKIDAPSALRMSMSRNGSPRKVFKRMNDYPTIGFRRSLVLLIEFSDKSFSSISDPKDYYTRMLNDNNFSDNGGTGSAAQYYHENSHGLFDVAYDVVGPIKLSNTYSYYGTPDDGCVDALMEACTIADKQGLVDFTKYDCNKDGVVDNIFYFFAGYGEADSGDKSTIWPNSWTLDEAGKELKLQGMKINGYACSNEVRGDNKLDTVPKPTGVGTFIHEFGHVLGLPDLYSTTYNMYAYTPENWDLMASGSYNNDMCTPPNLSAYEKWSLGWEQPQELTLKADSVLRLTKTIDGKSLMITGPAANEYFFFENRQQCGWDSYVPGHGMLIWHIDADSVKFVQNNVNNDMNHQCIDIVEASSVGKHPYDTYPGAQLVDHTDLYDWNNGKLSQQAKYIEERDSVITFVLDGVNVKVGDVEGLSSTNVTDSSFILKWNKTNNVSKYIVNISYKDGYGKTVSQLKDFATTKNEIDVTGLNDDTEYSASVYGQIGDSKSPVVSLNVKTDEMYFNKRVPTVLAASDITSTGFTANWKPLKNAKSYAITMNSIAYSENISDNTCDFSNVDSRMPESWQSSSSSFTAVKGYYGNAAPSLRLSNDGDYLIIGYPESLIYNLKFWYRSAKSTGRLYIDKNVGGTWEKVDSITAPSTVGTTVSYAFDGCAQVRIRYARVSGYVAIDDIVTSVKSIVRTPVNGFDNYNVGNVTSYTFTNLKPESNYGYMVMASDGSLWSKISDEMLVTTLSASGITDVNSNDVNVSAAHHGVQIDNNGTKTCIFYIFNSNGMEVSKSALAAGEHICQRLNEGIYVVKIDNKVLKLIVR